MKRTQDRNDMACWETEILRGQKKENKRIKKNGDVTRSKRKEEEEKKKRKRRKR